MQLLLEHEADVAARENVGRTALHEVADNEYEGVLQLQLKKEDVMSKNDNGWTALHWTVEKGHGRVGRLLVEMGAEITIKDDYG